jgi:VanZ family protein
VTQRARVAWLLVAMWAMGFEFYLSSIRGDELAAPSFEFSDKLLHAIAYGAIAGALRLAMGRPPRHATLGPMLRAGIAVAIAVAYGAFDELHQAYVPGRFSDGYDLLADTFGAMIGAVVAHVVLYRRRRDARP